MAVKKSDIYRSLWDSCDQLRGGMDASLYKDYILTLLFVKYVSDRAGQPDSLIEVPPGCSFEDMKALRGTKDIGEGMDKIIAGIAKANNLAGVVDRAYFNDAEKFGAGDRMSKKLTALVNIFTREDLNFSRNRADGDDILGDAYEYLMRNFATESGKSKGQFYTPSEVSRVVAAVAGVSRAKSARQTVYDPTCGSSSLLLKVAGTSPVALTIYGQEMDITTRGLAKMNMILHQQADAEIAQGDVLADPQFKEADGTLKTFDFVVANPPFSSKAWGSGFNPKKDPYKRFEETLQPPAKNGDFAFLLHILASMKATGSGAIILPLGVLSRGNVEAKLREKIARKGYIKGIISLPPNLFYGTGIQAAIIVLDKSEARVERPIFMIDASKGFMKDGNKNRLRERDIHRIIDTFERLEDVPGYARLVPFAEVEGNGFNLNLPRYVDISEPEDLQDIEAHLKGGVPDRDIDLLGDYWAVMPGVRSVLFGPNARSGYSDPLVAPGEVRATIRSHPDFRAFRERVHLILDGWRRANIAALRGLRQGDRPSALIHAIAEDMLDWFASAPLIDRYEAYQRLMSYWAATMQDDVFIIAGSGWGAARGLREARFEVEDGKTKWLEAADLTVKKGRASVRLVSDVIPPRLVIARFFSDLQRVLDATEAWVETIGREIEELVEEHGAEDGLLADALSEAGKLTAGAVKARLKAQDADAEERAMLRRAKDLLEAEASAKADAKAAEEKLTEAVLAKFQTMTEEEIRTLVIEDKWLDAIAATIEAEADARIDALTERIEVLVDRYGETLSQIESRLAKLDSNVAQHLLVMGYDNLDGDSALELLSGKRRIPVFSDDWISRRLGDLADIRSGGTPDTRNRCYWDGDIPWCTPTDITALRGRRFVGKTQRYISSLGLRNSSAEMLPAGTILMTSRATIGDCAITREPVCTNQGFKNFIVDEGVSGDFLYYLLLTLRPALLELCSGSTFLEIGKKRLATIEVRLPPTRGEQEAIASVLANADDRIEAVESRVRKLRLINEGMRQHLLTGRVRLAPMSNPETLAAAE